MSNPIEVTLGDGKGTIHGYCDDKFHSVLDTFIANFEDGEEEGASVCFNVDGETVVDLWGGRMHPRQASDWQEDTMSVVHSVTKAAV